MIVLIAVHYINLKSKSVSVSEGPVSVVKPIERIEFKVGVVL